MSWEADKHWADRFDGQIRQLLGGYFIQATPRRVDQLQAADYWVYHITQFTLGCRIRRYAYFLRYPQEVTFRLARRSGTPTEWHKLMHVGWGDYMFYGFADGAEQNIHAAYLLDLAEFRTVWAADQAAVAAGLGVLRYHDHMTRDGVTFRAIDVRSLPPGVVVAQWGLLPGLAPAQLKE